MGQRTNEEIRVFQERTGINPATGGRAKKLSRMSKTAHDLIRVLALEQAGIRDGDGYWHGCDPVYELAQELAAASFDRKPPPHDDMWGDDVSPF